MGKICRRRTRIYELFKCFHHARENAKNIDKCQNIQYVRSAWRDNNRIIICEFSEECNISCNSFQLILTEDLGKRRVFTKFVPKLLCVDQKADRLLDTPVLLKCAETEETFLKMIVIEDES
ncbi:hypothetical protein AVEN_126324-1 [Araneus ventricosus]|uniref:Uncharacterized protein n=1 Tax=Araneus ventricosus TaxID=182803 RepID=A0A4Y2FIN1_ARAVE|nr:hypothetical protein AVEN_126324-1 [Araneus ventricosus]